MVVNIKSKKHASSRVPGHAGSRGSLLAKLFLSTLYLSAFTFGGGYVIVTLMKKKFVDEYHWMMNRRCWIWWPLPSPRRAPSLSTGLSW